MPKLAIALESGGRAMLSINDDGVGIAESFDLGQTSTPGLQLVARLPDQFEVEIELGRSNPTRLVSRFLVE
jgi:two-component sensor histidine kinase